MSGDPNDWDDDDELGSTRVAESPFHRLQREAAAATRDRAYLMLLTGPDTGRIHRLEGGEHTVGRSSRADLQLDDDSISRMHAKVTLIDDHVIVEDLGSVNGTFVNGERCSLRKLQDGDKIRLGDTTILKFGIHDQLDEQFQQRLYQAALRDDLTQAYNKKYLLDHLAKELRYAVRHQTPLSIVMIDIDHFKQLNDTYGHVAGDAILAQLGSAVGSVLRTEDLFARFGGEEFCVVARGIPLERARLLAERLRVTIAHKTFRAAGHALQITASFGVASLDHGHMHTPTALIEAADEALYRAKAGGRNCVAVSGTGAG